MVYLADAKRGKRGRPVGKTNEGAEQVDSQGHVVENTANRRNNPSGNKTTSKLSRLKYAAFDTDDQGQVVSVKNPQVAKLYEQVLTYNRYKLASTVNPYVLTHDKQQKSPRGVGASLAVGVRSTAG